MRVDYRYLSMKSKLSLVLVVLSLVSGCAAKPLMPGGDTVVLSKDAPPQECIYVAEVQGSQGNFWTAEFTADADLINGARNELRNAAFLLQADYVKIETESISHNTADDSLGGAYSVVVIGNAYRCNEIVVSEQQ